MSKPIYITEKDFDEKVLKQEGKPVLVDFYADWCGPCKILGPILEEVAEEIGNDAIISKLNIDQNQSKAMEYGVMSIPTLIVFKDGEIAEKLVGLRSKEDILDILKKS